MGGVYGRTLPKGAVPEKCTGGSVTKKADSEEEAPELIAYTVEEPDEGLNSNFRHCSSRSSRTYSNSGHNRGSWTRARLIRRLRARAEGLECSSVRGGYHLSDLMR